MNAVNYSPWELGVTDHHKGYATTYTGDYPYERNDDPFFLAEPSALMVD